MISQLTGTVVKVEEGCARLAVGGMCYDVFLPAGLDQFLRGRRGTGEPVTLYTYYYIEDADSRVARPRLVGFLREFEREFFELFITVQNVGIMRALRAFTVPIPAIAQAIEDGNVAVLRQLNGIGPKLAERIIVELRGKVWKTALLPEAGESAAVEPARAALCDEAVDVLTQLDYAPPAAERLVAEALARSPEVESAEDLVREVFRKQKAEEAAK